MLATRSGAIGAEPTNRREAPITGAAVRRAGRLRIRPVKSLCVRRAIPLELRVVADPDPGLAELQEHVLELPVRSCLRMRLARRGLLPCLICSITHSRLPRRLKGNF